MWQNDNGKSVCRGMKTPFSVSDGRVQANQGPVYFDHLYIFLSTKNTSDIHYL